MSDIDLMEKALGTTTGASLGHAHAATLLFVALKDGLSIDHVQTGLSNSIRNADYFVDRGINQSPDGLKTIGHLAPSIREGFISALVQHLSALGES